MVRIGKLSAEVLHEVEAVAADQRVQARHAERTDLVLERAHFLGHEQPATPGPGEWCAAADPR